MTLPLHIFEDRYRTMIGRCLDEERPFGVLLIDKGREVGEAAVPHRVGTTAAITSVRHLDDGRMNIVTVGRERFRLRALHQNGPYLRGNAEPWPLSADTSEQAGRQVVSVRNLLDEYLERLEKAQGHRIRIESLPADPRAFALLVAVSLQVPLTEKQRLLTQPTVANLLSEERTILAREKKILAHIIETQGDQWEGGHSGLLARN
jgi:Lon protease-like protein